MPAPPCRLLLPCHLAPLSPWVPYLSLLEACGTTSKQIQMSQLLRSPTHCRLAMNLLWFATAAQKPAVEEDPEESAMKKRFEEWMVVHKRRYKDEEEKAWRYELFKGCVMRVNELNAASHPGEAWYKPSQYADFTEKEKSKLHGILVEPSMFDAWNDEHRRKAQRGHDGGADDWEEQMHLIQRGLRSAALDGKVQYKAQQGKVMSMGPSRGYLRHDREYFVELAVEVYPSML